MAQQHLGPVLLPQPRRAPSTAMTNLTTMPTTNETTTPPVVEAAGHVTRPVAPAAPAKPSSSPDFDSIYLPVAEKKTPAQHRLRAGCALVARRVYSLVLHYRLELVPAAATGTVSTIGWAQHLAGAGAGAATGYAAATAVAAGVSWIGLKAEKERLHTISAGVGIALADAAVAVGGGIGGASLMATVVATGVGYAGWVPWLKEHRKHEREVEAGKQAKVVKGTVVPNVPVDGAAPAPELAPANDTFVAPVAASSPFHDEVIPFSLDGETDDINDPIRIGWDENGQPVLLTMLYRHTLVAGASDWGKSGIINLIIKRLLRKKHVELYGIDLKPGAPELGPWEPLFKKLARTPEEVRELLNHLDAESKRRGATNEGRSQESYASGRGPVRKWIPGDPNAPKDSPDHGHGTAIYVITDELGELIRQDDALRKIEAEMRKIDPESYPLEQDLATRYESRLALDRFLAIHYVSATQQPSSKVFGGNTDARGNYANRISTRVGEAGHARLIFGEGCRGYGFVPEKLTRPGEFFLGAPEMPLESPPRCRAEYVTDMDIAEDVAHLHAATGAAPRPRMQLVKTPPKPSLCYPDGEPVGGDGQPSLYRVFCRLCEEHGSVTKDTLHREGPFDSRDTVRRAVDVWLEHGIIGEKEGAAWRYSLPASEEEVADGGA